MPPARPPRGTRSPAPPARGPRRAAPVLARQVRGEIVESVHRGHVVRVDGAGRVTHVAGDAEAEVTLRSCVKPFALVALAEAGGFRDYGLTPAEIALMASSHSGEDLHVRTLQGVFRRSGLTQTLLACGTEGAPLDALTAARLARDGERAGPIRHMCSGYHAAMLLLARLGDWSLEDYWQVGHPAQVAVRAAVARAFDDHARAAPDGDRRLRGRDLRVPAGGGRPGVSRSWPTRRRSRPATRGRAWRRRCARSATRWPRTRRWWAGRASGSTPRS